MIHRIVRLLCWPWTPQTVIRPATITLATVALIVAAVIGAAR